MRLIDETDNRYGRLLVFERSIKESKRTGAWWLCSCDCGNWTEVQGESLRNGNSTSCGCKTREASRKTIIAYNKTVPKSNPAKKAYYRRLDTLRVYGLSPEVFSDMLDEQRGCCKICQESLIEPDDFVRRPRLNIDHNHTTGEVRGLLCYNCNRMLGHAKDKTMVLIRAADYIRGLL